VREEECGRKAIDYVWAFYKRRATIIEIWDLNSKPGELSRVGKKGKVKGLSGDEFYSKISTVVGEYHKIDTIRKFIGQKPSLHIDKK